MHDRLNTGARAQYTGHGQWRWPGTLQILVGIARLAIAWPLLSMPVRLEAQASSVDPQGSLVIAPANTPNQTVTFRINNITGTRTRFILQCSPGGFVTSCSTPNSVTLNGFTNTQVTYDAFANQTLVTRATTNFPWPGETDNVQSGENYFYTADSTGRLLKRISGGEHDTLIYNKAGDLEFEYNAIATGQRSAHDRALYYAADGLLAAVDDRSATAFNSLYNSNAHYNFEEYRYDALGRRVLTRSRRKCDMNTLTSHRLPCLVSFLRRTVWDGKMELDEVQMPAGDTSTTAPAVSDAIMEQDTGYAPVVKVDTLQSPLTISDPNPFFGRLAYTYGLEIDEPVSVNRYGYVENAFSGDSAHHFAPYVLSPLWTAQGVMQVAVFGDGGAVTCDPTGATQRCTRKVVWLYSLTPYWRSINDQLSWQGTLLEDKQDASGLLYRRARYLDPQTGRFAQEDPIGFAGGMNLYGFAEGDPISFSDPFGLCVPWCTALIGAGIGGAGAVIGTVVWNYYHHQPLRKNLRRNTLIGIGVGGAIGLGYGLLTTAGGSVALTAGGTKIALGIDRYLDETAEEFGTETWESLEWGGARGGDMMMFRQQFVDFMSNAANRVVFNLRGVDIQAAAERFRAGDALSATDFELLQIANHPDWWSRIQWIGGSKPFANGNPFQP